MGWEKRYITDFWIQIFPIKIAQYSTEIDTLQRVHFISGKSNFQRLRNECRFMKVKANFLQIFRSAITAIFCHLIRHLNPISSCNGNYNDLLCGGCQQNLKTNHRKDFPSNIIIVLVEFLFKKVFKRNFPYKVLLLKTYTELCGGGGRGGGWEMMKRITNYDLAVSSLQRN